MRYERFGKARAAAAAILVLAVAMPAARFALPAAATPKAPPAASATHVRPSPIVAAKPQPAAHAPAMAAAAPQPPAIRHILDTHGPIKYGAWFWTDQPNATGPLTITIDLKASVLSVFRGGDEIGTTAIIYGEDGRDTPLGTFPILQKDRHHVSNLYHAPMPYMLRLTRDGISIHASEVAYNYATHGCIGVPAGFAKKLFGEAQLGDRVIVTDQGLRAT